MFPLNDPSVYFGDRIVSWIARYSIKVELNTFIVPHHSAFRFTGFTICAEIV